MGQFRVATFAGGRHVSASVFLQMIGASKSSAAVETLKSLVSGVCANVALQLV